MADSIRKLIMTDIGTKLATITTGNSFRTNIGNKVFEWKSKEWETREMPGVQYMDTSNSFEPWTMRGNGAKRGGATTNTLRIEFGIGMKASGDGGTNAEVMDSLRDAIADVYELISNDDTWGGNAEWTVQVSDDMGIDQDNKTLAGANIKIDIIYRTLAFQSDAQG